MKLAGGYAERPICSAAQVYGATWTGDDIPILLHTFEYIVRESLPEWWRSMLPGEEHDNVLTCKDGFQDRRIT
jgi:hypothetical protein